MMSEFDQLIAYNQSNALAQMASEPTIASRLAGMLKSVLPEQWSFAARNGVLGLAAIGVITAGIPLQAHADVYPPDPSTTAQPATQAQETDPPVLTAYPAPESPAPVVAPGIQQTPPPPRASSMNFGTIVGGIVGGVAGQFFGRGTGRVAMAALGAVGGAAAGTAVDNSMAQNRYAASARSTDYHTQQRIRDESGACFRQWRGEIAPTQTLLNNPQASAAMHSSIYKLQESYNEYKTETAVHAQQNENAKWAVDASEQVMQRQQRMNEDRKMIDVEKAYVFYRGTFLDKCNMAAMEGYDVRSYAKAAPLLALDTAGYVYTSPNPSLSTAPTSAQMATPRKVTYGY